MEKQTKGHVVRILPLGDSLTQGDGNPSAYRYDLYRLLAEDRIPVRFVGGVRGGDWRLPPDCRYHSGRGGVTSEGLLGFHTEGSDIYSPAWVEAVLNAEVVLLCIGANDIYRGLPVESYLERVDCLIDMLYSYNPSIATVFIATMRTAWSTNEKLRVMNAALLDPAFSAAHADKGRDVRVIDFNGNGSPENLPTDYPPDDGHPNEVGNRKLASIWHSAISARVRELSETLLPEDAEALPTPVCNSTSVSVSVGSGERIKLTPACGGDVSYLFESDDATVAEVDEEGTVYGRSEGNCKARVLTAYGRTHVATVDVYVRGVLSDVLDEYPVRYTPEISEKGYTAPEKALRPTANGVCVRYPHWIEGEIVSNEAYLQDNFCIAFEMTAVSALPIDDSGHLTLSLGDTSLTFGRFGTDMTLSAGGRSVKVSDLTLPHTRHPMRIVRNGDTVTLLRGGIVLLSLSCVPEASHEKFPLRIEWKDYHGMIHYFYGIIIATKE